jgi:hypothetical protein
MRPHTSIRHLLAFLVLLSATAAYGERLRINSVPQGAKVEIDGIAVGTTPFEKNYPGGYFHRTKTALGSRLEHPMIARVSLDGYATKELSLCTGPATWRNIRGNNLGEYWLIKSDHFDVKLETISNTFKGTVTARGSRDEGIGASSGIVRDAGAGMSSELSLTALVEHTKPAVVYLKRLEKTGTGFFVSDKGVIATNAHVARDEETLLTVMPDGVQLEATVVYIDANLDIALAKVEGTEFPHLTLAEASTVRQGENVVAIGNPGDAMLFSVTKGIVSAVGQFPSAGPGNSGGPLLNSRGEVVGINTQKLIKKNVSGIGFALSASDLISILRQFYPEIQELGPEAQKKSDDKKTAKSRTEKLAASPASDQPSIKRSLGRGTLVFTTFTGAEVFVDHKRIGCIPLSIDVPDGIHLVWIRNGKNVDWLHYVTVPKDSKLVLVPPWKVDEAPRDEPTPDRCGV